MAADDFTVADGGGGRLTMSDAAGVLPHSAKLRGSAFVAATLGDGLPAIVRLRPDDVRRLRDWCNGLLERHAAHLPVPDRDGRA